MSQAGHADIAVIGAAGQTGRALVCALVRRGAQVKAVVRRSSQAVAVGDAAAVEAAELRDAAALARALDGCRVAYYIPPVYNAREKTFGMNVISAACRAGVARVVYHSVLHAPTPAMPHHQRKSSVELALRESALAWTILQPAMYAQSPLAFLNAKHTVLRIGFDARQTFTPIDLKDLAEAAATVLMSDGHEFATYELAGSDRLSFGDMAAVMSEVLGSRVTVRVLPSMVVALVGATRFGVRGAFDLKAMLDHYDRHGLVGNANVLRLLLDREPTSFGDTMRRELGERGGGNMTAVAPFANADSLR